MNSPNYGSYSSIPKFMLIHFGNVSISENINFQCIEVMGVEMFFESLISNLFKSSKQYFFWMMNVPVWFSLSTIIRSR